MITAEVVVAVAVAAVVAFSSCRRRPRLPLPCLSFPAVPALPDTRWPLLRCFAWSVVVVAELTELLIVGSFAAAELMIVGSAGSLGHFVDWLHP